MMGETLTVTRGYNDKKGNWHNTGCHSITGVIAPGMYSPRTGQRAESSRGTGVELYVDKGADVRHRDRITRPDGQVFTVVSPPLWDGLHPLTGQDFRAAVYQLEAVTG